MEYTVALLVLLAIVAFIVARPLLRGETGTDVPDDGRRAELEAAKEAKYREIRDAQLDREMGKLSDEDHGRLDRELRGEAAEILAELDRLR